MRNRNLILFIIPAIIWGSTWSVIKFQLGTVDPLISVVYRYLLAGIVMLGYCLITKRDLNYTWSEHAFMALQGMLLFGVNYWLVYEAEVFLTSGLVAVAFSTIVFWNSGFGVLFLNRPINRKILVAALFGLAGTTLIFSYELASLNFSDQVVKGTFIVGLSVVFASLGNITSARNSSRSIPVIQANAFGMMYGGILMFILAFVLGRPFDFEMSVAYISSLVYLTIFGSVIAFGTYLTLISRVGADVAAYALVVIPVIAIAISVVFEGYQITYLTGGGVALIMVGNILALRK
jgi:drug/metabolite transporter (DMT)-like permease